MTAPTSGLPARLRSPRRPRAATLALGLSLLVCIASALWLVVRTARYARTAPRLSVPEVGRLAAAGRFEEAIERVEAALRAEPDNGFLRVMAAQLALDRPDSQPERALAHLGQVRSADPALAARAQLAMGKAAYSLLDCARAEICWLEALRLDPQVPEAAWALLDLYYLEGRREEARQLALGQHEIEPDPHDRVQFLLELVRQDAEPPDPGSLVARFTRVVRDHPDDRHAAIALGLALVRNSQFDDGLAILETAARRWDESCDAWDALLAGLDAAGQPERLAMAWNRLPPRWREDPRLARHAGNVAQARHDWVEAARAFRRAWDAQPDDRVAAYRLARALRILGPQDQALACDRFLREAQAAQTELLGLYQQANALTDLGLRPHTGLYHRLAENRERLGRREEARAWHRLVLRERPDDLYSRNALERLQSPGVCAALPAPGGANEPRRDLPSLSPVAAQSHDDRSS
jgi:tetratricopeptide (TPR) repeat protein